jgi:uncharacterized SAM-binding protein YcdF (DUF218 family)
MIALLIAILFYFLGKRRFSRYIFSILIFMVLILGLMPLGSWMIYPLESRFETNPRLPEQIDGIVILGGAVNPGSSVDWGQLEVNQYAERILALVELHRRFSQARVVFTGGNSSLDGAGVSESEILKRYLDELGVDPESVQFEARARNTAENASYTFRMVDPKPDSRWILVTSAYHMPRSVGAFCQAGWRPIPFPVDHYTEPTKQALFKFDLLGNATGLDMAMHEWIGLLAYYATGRTPELLPRGCRGTLPY